MTQDDWISLSFGDEDVDDVRRRYHRSWIYQTAEGMAMDHDSTLFGTSVYGEVKSIDACRQAVKDKRMFSFRVKYES